MMLSRRNLARLLPALLGMGPSPILPPPYDRQPPHPRDGQAPAKSTERRMEQRAAQRTRRARKKRRGW